MKKNQFMKTAIAAFVIATMPFAAQALQTYDSPKTKEIQGFRPYFPSVGVQVYKQGEATPFTAADETQKIQLKVGDVLRVPTALEEAAYNDYYTWADPDGTGDFSDKEDKDNIKLSFEWYRLEKGATTIDPKNDEVIGTSVPEGETVPSYTITEKDVGKQIGFRIKALSMKGTPKEGIYLDVPNIAYLGQQVAPTDPSENPTPINPGDEGSKENPDIKDKPITIDNEFIVSVYDITDPENPPVLVGDEAEIFVKHKYKAEIKKFNPETGEHDDVTDEYKDAITWNLYQGDTPIYEYLTFEGRITNIPTDPVVLENFDPATTPFTYEAVEGLAERFVAGDNTVFAVQETNKDALPNAVELGLNNSEQGLTLQVKLLAE